MSVLQYDLDVCLHLHLVL